MRSTAPPAWLTATTLILLAADSAPAADKARPIDFNREIRPILSESCYQCHGPDHNKLKADLRLDTRAGLFRTTDDATIVVPGKPDESELLIRITSQDAEIRMPPPNKGGRELPPAQIELVKRWIEEGAE